MDRSNHHTDNPVIFDKGFSINGVRQQLRQFAKLLFVFRARGHNMLLSDVLIQVFTGKPQVLLNRPLKSVHGQVGQFLFHYGRCTGHQLPGTHPCTFPDHGTGGNHGLFHHMGIIEHDGTDTHQAAGVDGASMDHCVVSHGNMVTDSGRFAEIGMNRAVVLDVRVGADVNRRHVSPQHRIEPDAGMVTNRDIADHDSRGCDKDIFSDGGYGSVVFDNHAWFFTPVHRHLVIGKFCRHRQVFATLPLNLPVSQVESAFQESTDFVAHLKVLAESAENRLGFD